MPKTVTQSGLMSKLGHKLAKAVEEHKDDETTLGSGGKLPSGIEVGVAQLETCKFDKFKTGKLKGEFYFQARGVILEPKEVMVNAKNEVVAEGGVMVKLEGRQTMIQEPVADTPDRSRKTIDEHVQWILNSMRKLGADTSDVSANDLEATAASLQEAAPTFNFRTWKGEKQTTGPYAGREPMLQEDWGKACEYTPDETSKGEVVDNTGAGEEPEPESEPTDDEATADENTASSDEGDELAQMGASADAGDNKARAKLLKMATDLGIQDEFTEADTFVDGAELIRQAQLEPAEDEGAADEEKPDPEKGSIVFYKPAGNDPKTKKPYKKAIECDVLAVYSKKQLVDLKNMDDGKTVYKAVPWDKLEEGA